MNFPLNPSDNLDGAPPNLCVDYKIPLRLIWTQNNRCPRGRNREERASLKLALAPDWMSPSAVTISLCYMVARSRRLPLCGIT
jgi:hypothetical protein